MIAITQRALDQIIALRASSVDESQEVHLRVDVIGGARSGLAYDLFFDRTMAGDQSIEQHGITLLLLCDSVPYLQGSTLDWVETESGASFLMCSSEPDK